jgi:DNA-binding NarL/FixJ family response regulator
VKNHIHRILRKVGVGDRLGIYAAFQIEGGASIPAHASHSA